MRSKLSGYSAALAVFALTASFRLAPQDTPCPRHRGAGRTNRAGGIGLLANATGSGGVAVAANAPQGIDYERDRLASHFELTNESYVAGIGQDQDQLLIWNCERQLVGPAYRWIAINSNFAKSLGWSPSKRPFEWLDETGQLMVKSVMWRDGWVGLEPPNMESLGEGCLVLATTSAIKAIIQKRPDAHMHLWVQRHSHGKEPYQASWHLTSPIADRFSL